MSEFKNKPLSWRDIVFAEIDGWSVYPLGIFIALAFTYAVIGLSYLFTGVL